MFLVFIYDYLDCEGGIADLSGIFTTKESAENFILDHYANNKHWSNTSYTYYDTLTTKPIYMEYNPLADLFMERELSFAN